METGLIIHSLCVCVCVCVRACVCVCVYMSTYLVVRITDKARTEISSVLKVSRPICLDRVETCTSGVGPKAGMMYLWQWTFTCCTWLYVPSLLSKISFSRRSLLLSCYDTFDTIAMRLKCDNDTIVTHNALLPITQNRVFPNKFHKFNICFLVWVCTNL